MEYSTQTGYLHTTLYQALFEHTPEAVLIVDPETERILEANPAAEQLWGYSRQQLCSMSIAALHPAEVAEYYRQKFQETVHKGAAKERGLLITRADGRWVPVELLARVFSTQDKRFVIGIFRDLREQQALREIEMLYRTLFETSLAGIYLLQDGKIVLVNPQAAAIFGYTPQEVEGMAVLELVAEVDRPLVAENLRKRLSGEELEARYRFRGKCKDGTIRYVEVRGRYIQYNGKPAILGTVLDVDDEVRAIERLAQSEARYRRLFEHSVAGYYRTTIDGRILAVNPALAHMLGYDDPAALEGQSAILLYFDQADRGPFIQTLRRHGRLVNYEVRLRRRDGRVLWGIENVLLVQEADGTEVIEGTLVDLTDLFEQRRRYLGLYNHTEDAIFWIRVTEDGQFLVEATNPSHQRKTGLTPEVLWKRPLNEILPPEIVAHVTANYRRCLEAGHPIEYEETLDLPAGRLTWLTQLVPIPDPDGQIRLIAGIARDITELRKLQALLEAEGQFLEQLAAGTPRQVLCTQFCHLAERFVEGARVSVWLYEAGKLHLCAAPHLPPAFTEVFEGHPISYQGSMGVALAHRQPVWIDNIENDPSWAKLYPLIRQTGIRAFWALPLMSSREELLGVIGLGFETVRIPSAEEQALAIRLAHLASMGMERALLRETRERLARVIAQISQGVALTDTLGNIVWVNDAFTRLTGYTLKEVRSKNIEHLLHGPQTDRETLRRMRLRLLRGRAAHARLLHYRKDGSTFWDEVHIDLLYDEQGQHVGYIGLMSDVTQLVEAEQQLQEAKERAEEASRLKSAFLANMSHEIRTPLTGILGFAELLDEELAARGQEDLREFAQIIDRSGRRLLTLLNDLLDLSKIEANRLELKLRPVQVNEIVEQAAQLMRPLALDKGLPLELELGNPPPAMADPNRLHQVVVNLLSNAIKFTDAGYVRVRTGVKDGKVWLAVEDTGCGIDPAFLPHIFEPFRQEQEGLNQTHQGAGLGLSIAHRLIELMRGQIRVSSEKGRGTTFEITLPPALPQA